MQLLFMNIKDCSRVDANIVISVGVGRNVLIIYIYTYNKRTSNWTLTQTLERENASQRAKKNV